MSPLWHPDQLIGQTVADRGGELLGSIDQVYLDDLSGEATWISLSDNSSQRIMVVPLTGAISHGNSLTVPFTRNQVMGSPSVHPSPGLDHADQDTLTQYYQPRWDISAPAEETDSGAPQSRTTADTGEGISLVRSEERLHIATEQVAAARIRFGKRIVTEMQTITIPVSREEFFLDQETTEPTPCRTPTGTPTHQVYETVLYSQRPVISMETVAVERVQLSIIDVAESQLVAADVRHEQVETTDPTSSSG